MSLPESDPWDTQPDREEYEAAMGTPMKEVELRTLTTCAACGKKIGQLALPIFWKVTVERHMLHIANVQRQQGLTMQIGATLAAVMGPDNDLTVVMEPSQTFMVCDPCAIEPNMCLMQALENSKEDAQ